jgi:ribosomal protein S25
VIIKHGFIQQELGNDQARVRAFAFFLLLKSRLSNSVVLNYSKKSRTSFISRLVGLDRNTVAIYMKAIKEYGWVKYSGGNLRLKSLDKDFDYRLKPDGKTDKKHQTKYFRIRVKAKDNITSLRALVRGLIIKLKEQWKAFCNLNSAGKQISEKELKECKRRMWDFRSRKYLNVEKPHAQVTVSLKHLADVIGMSKSTAYRLLLSLEKSRVIKVVRGKYNKLGNTDKLNPNASMPYGGFVYGKIVLKKECNAYTF